VNYAELHYPTTLPHLTIPHKNTTIVPFIKFSSPVELTETTSLSSVRVPHAGRNKNEAGTKLS